MVTKKQGTCAICGTPVLTRSKYCRRHAALRRWGHTDKDQARKYREEQEKAETILSFTENLPSEVTDVLREVGGRSEYRYLEDDLGKVMNMARLANSPPMHARSQGGYESMLYGSMYVDKINKPNPSLDYASDFNIENIEDMLKCGQVVFGLALKKAPVASIFRNRRSYAFEFEGVKPSFQAAIEENLYELFPQAVTNFLTSLEYGASFNEVVWKIDKNNPLVADINSIYLGAIKKVMYKGGSFNGFEQTSSTGGEPIKIPLDQSLVISYNKKFRNIYGESALKPVYPFFFFYDIIWRSFVRYLERTGTPQLLATAPQGLTVRKSNGEFVEALDEALDIAYRGSRSPAIAIPSDTDVDGNPLWTLQYLKSDMRGDQFISALSLLGTLILRSVILPDTVATTQSTGSYGMADVHYQMTLLDSERVVVEIISQLNKYLLAKYVTYKYGDNSEASIKLVTEGLNVAEKDALLKMMMQAINAKHEVANSVDWKALAAVNNIPILPEGEEWEDKNFGGTEEEPEKVDVAPKPKAKEKAVENNAITDIKNILAKQDSSSLIVSDAELKEVFDQ